MPATEIDYTERELRSFLKTGWSLDETSEPGWRPDRGAWVATLRDGSDFTWEVVVRAEDVTAVGRTEALGRAVRSARRRW